jgi:hypothetical protein
MLELVNKYFHKADGEPNEFNPPASEEKLVELEKQLACSLPVDFKDFLKFTNGFEGMINEFVVIFDPVEKIYQETLETCAEYHPWAVYIGTNGSTEMYVIDKRQSPYQFGLLPFIGNADDFIPLGDTFEKFVARLYNDTVW